MDPPSPVAAFEQAALDSQVPSTRVAAEATLDAFTAHSDILQISLTVIFQTKTAVARYYAATALRTAGLERWESISLDARYSPTDSLRVQLVQFAISHPLHLYERSALLRVAATLTRRAYLEEPPENRRRFFDSVCAAASQEGAAANTQQIGTALEMLSMLIAEFSLTSATAGELSEEAVNFAGFDGELFAVFRAASAALSQAMLTSSERPPDEARSLARLALVTISDVLSFGQADVDSKAAAVYGIHRGPEWHGTLLQLESLCQNFFQLFHALHEDDPSATDTRRALFDALDAVAIITRQSYPSAESADATLLVLLRGLEGREWSVSNPRSERLLYAELWRRFCVAHEWRVLVQIAPGVLDSFAKNTLQLLRARSVEYDDEAEGSWSAEADCLLLETWAGLAIQAEAAGQAQLLQIHAGKVVLEFIEHSLIGVQKSAEEDNREDFGFDDESHEEAQLEAAAVLCRQASVQCFARLASVLGDLSRSVFLAAGSKNLTAAQEGLVWTVRLSSAVLADDGQGEVPDVPEQFAHGGVNELLGAVLATADLETRSIEVKSPRLEAVILECLTRLSHTYLLPSNVEQEALAVACLGGNNVAVKARIMCLRKSIVGICERTFEPDVANAAAALLAVLAPGRSSGSYPELRDDKQWQPLPSLGFEKFESLSVSALEMLGTALSHFFADKVGIQLVEPASAALKGFGATQNRMADASERAVVALHLLCGVTQCTQAAPYVHDSVVAALRSPDGGVFCAVRSFAQSNQAVLMAALEFAKSLAGCHLPLLQGEAAASCFVDSVNLIEQVMDGMGRISSQLCSDDIAPVVASVLELLQSLLNAAGSQATCDRAFYGLKLVLPLMTDQIMTYPSVRPKYFKLVDDLAASFPDYIPKLPVGLGERFLSSVMASACRTYEDSISQSGLEAVKALGVFRVRNSTLGGAHLPSMSILDRSLAQCAVLILEGIMLGGGRFGTSFDAACEAFLPLTLGGECGPSIYEQARHSLRQTGGDTDTAALSALKAMFEASQQVAPVLDFLPGGGKRVSSPLSERIRAQAFFSTAVRKFAGAAKLTATRM